MENNKELPFRIGVGIALLNHENKVFVGKRIDNPKNFWQMPQWGVDPNEDFLSAAIRELEEERSFTQETTTTSAGGWYDPLAQTIMCAKSGGMLMGICNGFQILTETELLPGALLRNKYSEFICKNVFVKINNSENSYFKKINKNILELHIAHNEGNYFCSNRQLKEIEDGNQIALSYCDENGEIDEKFNPNGSNKSIAGIFNKKKNILGMMPHPERMIDKYLSGDDGAIFFKNLLNNLK